MGADKKGLPDISIHEQLLLPHDTSTKSLNYIEDSPDGKEHKAAHKATVVALLEMDLVVTTKAAMRNLNQLDQDLQQYKTYTLHLDAVGNRLIDSPSSSSVHITNTVLSLGRIMHLAYRLYRSKTGCLHPETRRPKS